MRWYISARLRAGLALGISSLVSVLLYVLGAVSNHSTVFGYMIWNLFLAWLPVVFAVWLGRSLYHRLWSNWLPLLLTVLWLGFLPNSFYMISDFIHVQEVRRVDLLYDIVMFASFILNGVILGFLSVYLVHGQLLRRVRRPMATTLIGLVLLLCSFAVYLGRDLRWNTWDILINPTGVLLGVSDPIVNPHAHPQAFTTTITFFVLLASLYVVVYQLLYTARLQKTE